MNPLFLWPVNGTALLFYSDEKVRRIESGQKDRLRPLTNNCLLNLLQELAGN